MKLFGVNDKQYEKCGEEERAGQREKDREREIGEGEGEEENGLRMMC